jgi:hypothetical protein
MDEAGVSHGAQQREAAPLSAKAFCAFGEILPNVIYVQLLVGKIRDVDWRAYPRGIRENIGTLHHILTLDCRLRLQRHSERRPSFGCCTVGCGRYCCDAVWNLRTIDLVCVVDLRTRGHR